MPTNTMIEKPEMMCTHTNLVRLVCCAAVWRSRLGQLRLKHPSLIRNILTECQHEIVNAKQST
jgi:hypothetical protein